MTTLAGLLAPSIARHAADRAARAAYRESLHPDAPRYPASCVGKHPVARTVPAGHPDNPGPYGATIVYHEPCGFAFEARDRAEARSIALDWLDDGLPAGFRPFDLALTFDGVTTPI